MPDRDPLWFKDAVIYELHVRAFQDSVGDGYGDFRGLTSRLDYLQDLGVTTLWLLPFYPSPGKDDGYDIADYLSVHEDFGTLDDFKDFLAQAHDRGLRVITELVLNHTSDQHPWFQLARLSPPGSPERDFYVWSDTPDKYREARIIFKDTETSNWARDPVANAYYWHRFYSHQPDLNFDNPAVLDALLPVVDFWLGLGVDGLRLDAVPYLFEREGTSCENLPETHAFLKRLRRHVDQRFPDRMLLAEANQWPEDAVEYFGAGDECHMAFHFPVMPRLYMAVHVEDRFPIQDTLEQTPAIPPNCQWGMFLRNHDELTLEMVTDEQRDLMYRAYAPEKRARINLGIRRRLAPLLANDRRKIELMNGLLFSLPGTPFLYYGDEIGMGDNFQLGDRNGVRTPMQWSADRNAGFSRASPQSLYLPVIIDPEYHYQTVNVEAQQNNPSSLLWWMKRLIALRKRHRAFSRGTLTFLEPANRKVLAFIRRHEDESILVVANLSRFVQHVELDLGAFQGHTPVELFGRNALPPLGAAPYPLTLGPHAFYWLALERRGPAAELPARSGQELPRIRIQERWEEALRGAAREALVSALAGYLERRPWARGPAAGLRSLRLRRTLPIRAESVTAHVCLLDADYAHAPPASYLVPVAHAAGEAAREVRQRWPDAVLALLDGPGDGLLYDALATDALVLALVKDIAEGRTRTLERGDLVARPFVSSDTLADLVAGSLAIAAPEEWSGGTSFNVGGRAVLRVLRRLEEGIHPEVEVGRYLALKSPSVPVAPILGVLEYRRSRAEPSVLAILRGHVKYEGTAWQAALDNLSRTFEQALTRPPDTARGCQGGHLAVAARPVPEPIRELIGSPYLKSQALLGQRVAEVHLALAADRFDPDFAPEMLQPIYLRSLRESLRQDLHPALERLRARLPDLPSDVRPDAQRFLASAPAVEDRLRRLLSGRLTGWRIRIHGDLNLTEVLCSGDDFVIRGFEGPRDRSLSERRIRRIPLRDVASMVRSFHYAAFSALRNGRPSEDAPAHLPGLVRPEDVARLEPWAEAWYLATAGTFLRGYLDAARTGSFLPPTDAEVGAFLETFLFGRALRELAYELDRDVNVAAIPLRGVLHLLDNPC